MEWFSSLTERLFLSIALTVEQPEKINWKPARKKSVWEGICYHRKLRIWQEGVWFILR